MKTSILQLINLSVILIVMVFLVKYLYDLFFGNGYEPVNWAIARKSGRISKHLLKLKKNYPDKIRFFNWWFQVERLKKEHVQGAFAEVGVYKGESAAVLHHMDPSRKLLLFDTFDGFPATDLQNETGEAATYTTKNFKDTTPEQVLKRISGNENVIIQKGYFPESLGCVADETYSLVNLDADLHNPTKAALEYFYSRLNPGGVIFIHDYNKKWTGITHAVDEFLLTIKEKLILLPDSDCTAVIVKSGDDFIL